ncbi:MAG TPA: hypothetical protein VHT91_05880 [Kofleriaceae bacterium]|nr:hypothetical protein [Kofleriaceae bacterium]
MRRAAWLALVAAGCNQVLGVTDPHLHEGGPLGSDAGGLVDGATGCAGDGFGYTISNVASCDILAAAPATVALNSTIDTTAGTVTVGTTVQPLPASALVPQLVGGQLVRVVSVDGFRVPPGITVNVVGQYGLVVVVRGDVEIDGAVIVSADHTTAAAGSRSAAACSTSAGASGTLDSGGGGGASNSSGGGGGGHGGSGAAGGASLSVVITPIPGGVGGVADGNVSLRPLRGGCPGGVSGGAPAAGGGAIQISASGRIDLSGTIAAAGGGGFAHDPSLPAPAGGSGGGILLEAGTITLTASAAVTANGGAGADGSGTVAACSGENGRPRNAIPAVGGSCNGSTDITGGAGGAGTTPAHGGDTGMRGTGGGGGVGRIAIHSPAFAPVVGSVVSPAPNITPF